MNPSDHLFQNYGAGYFKKCSTSELNFLIADHERLIREGKPIPRGAVDVIQAEKDRRLSDPNSPDFRPTFF